MTYEEIGQSIGELVDRKNSAYGNSYNMSYKILEVLFPSGVPVEKYKDMLAITRIIDKLFRIATQKDAFNEDPWSDICGYSILGLSNTMEKKINE